MSHSISKETEPLLKKNILSPSEESINKQIEKENKERKSAQKRLILTICVCFLFMIGEIVGGYLANSLSIMTDAAHLLSDLASMMISLFSIWLAGRPATLKLSFGYHRAEILGALVSVLMIWLLTGILVYEAVNKIIRPESVDGKIMFITALCGLFVNIFMALALGHHGHNHSNHNHDHSDNHENHSHGKHNHENHSHDKHNHNNHNHDQKSIHSDHHTEESENM